MKFHRDFTTVWSSQVDRLWRCELSVEDDSESPLLTIYADVRGYRIGEGEWEHERTEITGIDLGCGQWQSSNIRGCFDCRPVWSDEIAERMEAAYLEDLAERMEGAA